MDFLPKSIHSEAGTEREQNIKTIDYEKYHLGKKDKGIQRDIHFLLHPLYHSGQVALSLALPH